MQKPNNNKNNNNKVYWKVIHSYKITFKLTKKIPIKNIKSNHIGSNIAIRGKNYLHYIMYSVTIRDK